MASVGIFWYNTIMIYLASDHAGFELKEKIKKALLDMGLKTEDMGAHEFVDKDDYPDYVIPVAKKVAESEENRGIVFGWSGQGEAIAANKIQGIRAAVYYGGSLELVRLSRFHNNANILSLGAGFLTSDEALDAVKLWLDTEFEGGRHERRIEKIREAENG